MRLFLTTIGFDNKTPSAPVHFKLGHACNRFHNAQGQADAVPKDNSCRVLGQTATIAARPQVYLVFQKQSDKVSRWQVELEASVVSRRHFADAQDQVVERHHDRFRQGVQDTKSHSRIRCNHRLDEL